MSAQTDESSLAWLSDLQRRHHPPYGVNDLRFAAFHGIKSGQMQALP
jgi:hypothetical protein